MERACGPQARHDDPHQPGDNSCLWYIARRNIRPLRDRCLVGTLISDYDHAPRPLARNASYFPGPWRTINALAALLPDTAERVNGAEIQTVPLSDLRVGDL